MLIKAVVMASIPMEAIKSLIKKQFGVKISDDGAAALAKILERKADAISKFAVDNAKKEKRDRITKKDIEIHGKDWFR